MEDLKAAEQGKAMLSLWQKSLQPQNETPEVNFAELRLVSNFFSSAFVIDTHVLVRTAVLCPT